MGDLCSIWSTEHCRTATKLTCHRSAGGRLSRTELMLCELRLRMRVCEENFCVSFYVTESCVGTAQSETNRKTFIDGRVKGGTKSAALAR